jgi:hypothetical protein
MNGDGVLVCGVRKSFGSLEDEIQMGFVGNKRMRYY